VGSLSRSTGAAARTTIVATAKLPFGPVVPPPQSVAMNVSRRVGRGRSLNAAINFLTARGHARS